MKTWLLSTRWAGVKERYGCVTLWNIEQLQRSRAHISCRQLGRILCPICVNNPWTCGNKRGADQNQNALQLEQCTSCHCCISTSWGLVCDQIALKPSTCSFNSKSASIGSGGTSYIVPSSSSQSGSLSPLKVASRKPTKQPDGLNKACRTYWIETDAPNTPLSKVIARCYLVTFFLVVSSTCEGDTQFGIVRIPRIVFQSSTLKPRERTGTYKRKH